jgi:NAD-dependent dihydropyrimidine dehydrogenase PreA subunit
MKKLFSRKKRNEYRIYKKRSDPHNLINPAKSFSPDSPLSILLKTAYSTSALFANGFHLPRSFLKIMSNGSKNGQPIISETESCANCGACIAVCPAYLKEKTECITAKGKLFLLQNLLNGSSLSKSTAEGVFFCLHCHLCEYVCQSKLSLTSVWERLESIVEKKYGRPEEKIKEFIEQVESDPAYTQLLNTFGIAPDNFHEEKKNV